MKAILAAGLLCGCVHLAQGFALLGPLGANAWQVLAIGYALPGDIGVPVNLSEEYRWNAPKITYAFDQSFLNYFGAQGVQAVEAAIKILNNLPPVSKLSQELTEYPTDNKKVNYTAKALGIQDLKSTTLSLLLEVMGLAEPERWSWCLRDRATYTIGNITYTNYLVIQRNFDPVTFQPTNRVNSSFYGYTIGEPLLPGNHADALETALDPLTLVTYSSVAGGLGTLDSGELYTGLTRDDMGGWRYLLRGSNYNVEPLPAGVIPYFTNTSAYANLTNSPWSIYLGTNYISNTMAVANLIFGTNPPWTIVATLTNTSTNIFNTNATNIIIQTGLRGGLERIQFVRTSYDSLLGQAYSPITNIYNDIVISNYVKVTQKVQRVTLTPDILFAAEDLGTVLAAPVTFQRGRNTVNNDAINGNTTHAGPGNIAPPIVISFSDILPGYMNTWGPNEPNPGMVDAIRSQIWGSFTASPDTPIIIYPNWISLAELEAMILNQ